MIIADYLLTLEPMRKQLTIRAVVPYRYYFRLIAHERYIVNACVLAKGSGSISPFLETNLELVANVKFTPFSHLRIDVRLFSFIVM